MASPAPAEHGYRLIDLAALARIEPLAQAALDRNDAHAWRTLPANSPFRQAFERYLDEYGHRCVCEWDFASPRWRVDPAYLLEQIRGLSEMTPDFVPRGIRREVRSNAETELHRLNWLVRTLASWMLSRTRTGAVLRESASSAAAASVELIQSVLLEVGERMVERELVHMASDVFHLAIPDLEAYLCGDWSGDGAADLVEDRRRCLANWENESAPDVIVEGQGANRRKLDGETGSRSTYALSGRQRTQVLAWCCRPHPGGPRETPVSLRERNSGVSLPQAMCLLRLRRIRRGRRCSCA